MNRSGVVIELRGYLQSSDLLDRYLGYTVSIHVDVVLGASYL